MEKQPVLSMAVLQKDIRLEVSDKRTSLTREGVVSKINIARKCGRIDGRPVCTSKISEVIISFQNGEQCVLTPDNFKYYKIKMLG